MRTNLSVKLRPRPRATPAPDAAEFCAKLREHLAAELDRPSPRDASITNFQALSEKLVQMAVGGSKDAIHVLLDRLAGRVPQAPSAAEDAPAKIEYVIEMPRPYHARPGESTETGKVPAVSAPERIP